MLVKDTHLYLLLYFGFGLAYFLNSLVCLKMLLVNPLLPVSVNQSLSKSYRSKSFSTYYTAFIWARIFFYLYVSFLFSFIFRWL